MKAFKKLTKFTETNVPINSTVYLDGEGFQDAFEAVLHPDAHEEGGIGFTDRELLERQRGAVVEVVKQLGSNLLTGNFDLLKMSLPIKLFEPRSYLQKLADPWVYPRFLGYAAETVDPIVRMKWVVTWFIAGLHHVFERWAKPFNPILGETWQASLPDGSSIFLEQISHHPPISAFELCGPGNKYVFSGLSQPAVSYKTNAVRTTAKGYRAVMFADGTQIRIEYPAYFLKGLLYTNMPRAEILGDAEFNDAANNLRCVITFGKVGRSCSPLLNRTDAFAGTLFQGTQQRRSTPCNSSSNISAVLSKSIAMRNAKSAPALDECTSVLASCSGNWLSHIDWGEERFWTLGEDQPQDWIPTSHPLPSDCRFRKDLMLLQQGKVKDGQEAKELLENQQRNDAKLRKAGSEE